MARGMKKAVQKWWQWGNQSTTPQACESPALLYHPSQACDFTPPSLRCGWAIVLSMWRDTHMHGV